MHLPGSALEGRAVFEGEGQAAIRVGCGVVQQATPELFAEGGDLAVLLLENSEEVLHHAAPFEDIADLLCDRILPLAPCAVLGNGSAFFLREARHDGQQDLTLVGMEGKHVHIVEMRDRLAPDANIRHRPLLMNEIDKYVTVHTSCKGLEVREDGILCEDAEGKQVLIPGTTVICALGQRSNTVAVRELQDAAPFVRVIGDASRVSTITNAVYWGHHAALDI